MNPLAFRQFSPITTLGCRVVPGLFVKAGLPRGGISGKFQSSSEPPHEGPTPLVGSKGVSSPIVDPKGVDVTSRLMPPTSKPATPTAPKIVTPGPVATPGSKITPASSVIGSTARTPEEHRAIQMAAQSKPEPSQPQPQYGPKMTQATGRKTGQTVLPGVAVHQQAMRGGAGTQLELPGGAAMHTPTGKEPKPARPETIGQAEARHRQTFGSASPQMVRPSEIKDLQAAVSAKPMQAEGGQMLLPGMSAAGRKEQSRAAQKLQAKQSEVGRENVSPGQQMELGSHITKERGPATEAGKVGETMRTGTPEERRAAIKQAASGLRQRAEAFGRQEPRGAKQPEFVPAKTRGLAGNLRPGENVHNNLSDYHSKMAEHHDHLFNTTNDPKHLAARDAHKDAAAHNKTAAGGGDKFNAVSRSENAENLSKEAGVAGSLSRRVSAERAKEPVSRGPSQAPAAVSGRGGRSDAPVTGREGPAGSAGTGRTQGGSYFGATRSGWPRRGTQAYGVAGPNIMGNYAAGYGSGLAAGQLGGPMFQTAQLAQEGMGKFHSLAQTRRRLAPDEMARYNQMAANQRQQQLQQLYQVANKSMIESTPITRTGSRRIG